MKTPSGGWSDQRIERIIGDLLRTGVVLSAFVVLMGSFVYLKQQGHGRADYGIFRGEPSDMRSVRGIAADAVAGHGDGIIQLGLLLLIATPFARVVFSVFAFAVQRDMVYVLLTLVVLAVLAFSLSGGRISRKLLKASCADVHLKKTRAPTFHGLHTRLIPALKCQYVFCRKGEHRWTMPPAQSLRHCRPELPA